MGALALQTNSAEPSVAEPAATAPVTQTVFLVEMNHEVCASQTPIHTTTSSIAVNSDGDQDETLPSGFLVMLQDGVCASQSPISTSPRNSVVAEPEKKELLLTASNSS